MKIYYKLNSNAQKTESSCSLSNKLEQFAVYDHFNKNINKKQIQNSFQPNQYIFDGLSHTEKHNPNYLNQPYFQFQQAFHQPVFYSTNQFQSQIHNNECLEDSSKPYEVNNNLTVFSVHLFYFIFYEKLKEGRYCLPRAL